MSLQQLAAQRMAAQGRGPDSQLVHMSPREVAGLQALAMAQGGSLTINPETGLPEAGFLDKMLPMILGIGATALTGGAAAPWMVGLGVGALQTARTGSLEKGLMAGLGAYGGAGLGAGLMAAGAGAGAGAGTVGAEVGSLGAAQAAPAFDPAGMVASPYYDSASLMSPVERTGTAQAGRFMPFEGPANTAQNMAYEAAQKGDIGRVAQLQDMFPDTIRGQYTYDMGGGARSYSYPTTEPMRNLVDLPPISAPVTPPPVVEGLGMGEPGYTAADMQAYRSSLRPPTIPPAAVQPSMGQNLSQAGQGFKNLGTEAGRKAFMGQAASKGVEATGVGGGMGLLKYGAAAAAPMLMGETKTKMPEDDKERFNYAFDAGRTEEGYVDPITGQRQYFRPTYTRYAAAGGPVEEMSAANVYDMQNARGGVSDMGIDNSTGMQRMAGGGISSLKALSGYGADEARDNYTYDPTTKKYAKIAPVVSPIAVAAALNAMDAGGYGGVEMSAGPGMGFSATSGQLGPGASAAEATAIGAAMGEVGGADGGGGLAGQGASGDTGVDGVGFAYGGLSALARGGMSHLGDYSDGGRLLKGPGDGVSDSIPAMIGNRQPARLADGEFVVPARIVSELGNGSTEAGARKLYAMMDRIQKARGKTVGKGKVAKNSRAEKYLPA